MVDDREGWLKQLGRSLTSKNDWYPELEISDTVTRADLKRYFERVRDRIKGDMAFVREPISRYRQWSASLRLLGVVAIGCGILLPAIFADQRTLGTNWLGLTWNLSGLEAAYIAVALGGILLLLDQVFDLTNGWTRLFIAESKLKSVLEELEFDWAIAWSQVTDANIKAEAPKLIEKLQAAARATNVIMHEQKSSWTGAVRTAWEALRTRLEADRGLYQVQIREAEQARARPSTGSINLIITNPLLLKPPVRITLNGEARLSLLVVPSGHVIGNVAPGLHAVEVAAERATGQAPPYVDAKSAHVTAGEAKDFAFTVPAVPIPPPPART